MKNIFLQIAELQERYKSFIKSYQNFDNEIIKDWVNNQINSGIFIYQKPVIDLIPQYKLGETLEELINSGIIHKEIIDLFHNKSKTGPIHPYKHQESAIHLADSKKNFIVSTGTGSGKSMTFWIPIISECLKARDKGEKGIKAIIIYPMNALANSQYNDIIQRLHGTGLKIVKYTGELKRDQDTARSYYKNILKREQIYDCEIISREEIHNKPPPDILITNYKMLELILTRLHDQKIFRKNNPDTLKFIILDEIHTYAGNSGADVGCLLRRLKQRVGATNVICIGTSATIESESGSQSDNIRHFAENMFGKPFNQEKFLIQADYVEEPYDELLELPDQLLVNQSDLDNFNGTLGNTLPLTKALLKDPSKISISIDEKTLGDLFQNHPTIVFIRELILTKGPLTIEEISECYSNKIRLGWSIDDCSKEIQAALLVGTVARGTYEGKERALLVPKIHLFFTQGMLIFGCLSSNDRESIHLQLTGDLFCSNHDNMQDLPRMFPLLFCKQCGGEFFGVKILDDGALSLEYYNEYVTGTNILLCKGSQLPEAWQDLPIPDEWFTKTRKIAKNYRDAVPYRSTYCYICNRLDSSCDHSIKFPVWVVSDSFRLCPICGALHAANTARFRKFYYFDIVGRSTATDILVSNTLKVLSEEEKRMLVFSDNRQETAFQAGHLRDFQRRTNFQHLLTQTLKDAHLHHRSLRISTIGSEIYQTIQKYDFPVLWIEGRDEFEQERSLKQYLTFLALSELKGSTYILHTGIERFGILEVEYQDFDQFINNEPFWTEIPLLRNITSELRHDYLRGILDEIRWFGGIYHDNLNETSRKWSTWCDYLELDYLFDPGDYVGRQYGFSDEEFNIPPYFRGARVKSRKYSTPRSLLNTWTRSMFNCTADEATNLLHLVRDVLIQKGYLKSHTTNFKYKNIYQINSDKIILKYRTDSEVNYCLRCQRVYSYKVVDSCIKKRCGQLDKVDWSNNYYYRLYNSLLSLESSIIPSEHSAQLDLDDRTEIEGAFNEGKLNVLVCSPTMELGIDIGDLSSVLLRNMPPDPSRYAQRAGRAGRSERPSFILVFSSSSASNFQGPHDRYFYLHPEKIISGRITPPQFELDNKKLITKHINSIVIQIISDYYRIDKQPKDIYKVEEVKEPDYECLMDDEFSRELENALDLHKDDILKAVEEAFSQEISIFPWFSGDFIKDIVTNFKHQFDSTFNYFKDLLVEYARERETLHTLSLGKLDSSLDRRISTVRRQIAKMWHGNDEFYIFNYLSNHGFLPNYGFSSASSHIQMYKSRPPNQGEKIVHRDSVVAIREFAPFNTLYFMGSKYNVRRAQAKRSGEEIDINKLYLCSDCFYLEFGSRVESLQNCPSCEKVISPVEEICDCIPFPNMKASSGENIGCDEEKREIKYYEILPNYKENKTRQWQLEIIGENQEKYGEIKFEHDALIYHINKGHIRYDPNGRTEPEPFHYCSACNQWLFKSRLEDHISDGTNVYCKNRAVEADLYKNVMLVVQGSHDVMQLFFSCPENISEEGELAVNQYYVTLLEAFIQSILLTFNLTERELGGFILPKPNSNDHDVIIFEAEEGGTGVLKSLIRDTNRWKKMLRNMIGLLHLKEENTDEEKEDACQHACYNCLLGFWNQRNHQFINRKRILPIVRKLMATKTKEVSSESGSNDLQELLDVGLDSRLEKRVITMMSELNISMPDEVQKTINDTNGNPITRTDLFYSDIRLAVFIDGPPHANQQEEDKNKRRRVRRRGIGVYSMDLFSGVGENQSISDDLIKKRVLEFKEYIER